MKCPVCGSDAENKGSRDYGDKDRIECPRCGPYEISRTALAMLRSRLGGSPTAPARLSHALRMEPRKDGEWFMVTSANIDELLSRPLPDVERQMNYLLVWLSVQVGDDHLGFCPIDRGTVDELAGVVGAVDGERVDRLLEFAVKEGLIEIPHSGSVGITPKGWEMLTGEKQKVEAPKPEGEVVEVVYENDENTIVKANCNICGGTKKSFRRRMERHHGNP